MQGYGNFQNLHNLFCFVPLSMFIPKLTFRQLQSLNSDIFTYEKDRKADKKDILPHFLAWHFLC